jgi:hypothetical protein
VLPRDAKGELTTVYYDPPGIHLKYSCAFDPMTIWKTLLLIYSGIDVSYRCQGNRSKRFAYVLSEQEVQDAINSFEKFPVLVEELTAGRASIQYQINRIERHLTSLTLIGQEMYWPSPDDTRDEIERFAPSGRYDSIFVLWPQRNLADGTSIPSGGWGLAIAASRWSNEATYAAVANTETWRWQIPMIGEVWLHEWLHGACAFFARKGYLMPHGDADGGARHGYNQSPVSGWIDYYRDLMSGNVLENGKRIGIPLGAWADTATR